MTAGIGARARMERATLGSIAIHVLVALSIPALAWTISDDSHVETVSFSRILRVAIVRPPAPAPRPRAVAPQHAAKPAFNAVHKPAPHRVARRRETAQIAVATRLPAAPAVAAVAVAGDVTSNARSAPAATPSPGAREVASTDARQEGGYLPFGAEQPTPVLDPSVRKRLDSLDVHVTLIITVGDDGRTTSVAFTPPIDPQLESRIRALLADADWDPAVCGGGVSCQGQATIRL